MADKSDAVAAAEAALQDREKFVHAVHDANTAVRTAEMSGDGEKVKRAQGALADAIKAHQESGVTDRELAELGQAVLDARGESHTEVNVLPPDFGVELVDARQALAQARMTQRKSTIAEAEAHHDKTEKAVRVAKAEHVAGGAERTKAVEAAAIAEGQ